MKTLISIACVVLMSAYLSGCSYFASEDDQNPQNSMCKYLKRQMVYNGRANAADARFIADSQKQDLQERYEEYGCK